MLDEPDSMFYGLWYMFYGTSHVLWPRLHCVWACLCSMGYKTFCMLHGPPIMLYGPFNMWAWSVCQITCSCDDGLVYTNIGPWSTKNSACPPDNIPCYMVHTAIGMSQNISKNVRMNVVTRGHLHSPGLKIITQNAILEETSAKLWLYHASQLAPLISFRLLRWPLFKSILIPPPQNTGKITAAYRSEPRTHFKASSE